MRKFSGYVVVNQFNKAITGAHRTSTRAVSEALINLYGSDSHLDLRWAILKRRGFGLEAVRVIRNRRKKLKEEPKMHALAPVNKMVEIRYSDQTDHAKAAAISLLLETSLAMLSASEMRENSPARLYALAYLLQLPFSTINMDDLSCKFPDGSRLIIQADVVGSLVRMQILGNTGEAKGWAEFADSISEAMDGVSGNEEDD